MNILIYVVICLLQTLTFAILARSILSWFPMKPGNVVTIVLMGVTEPVLGPLRRIVPRFGMIDLSPMIAILLLMFMSRALQAAY